MASLSKSIFMDYTYKTIQVSIGQTTITDYYTSDTDLGRLGFPSSRSLVVAMLSSRTFPIAIGLLSSKREEAYRWAADWLLQRIDHPSAIKVIQVDCEIALINALDSPCQQCFLACYLHRGPLAAADSLLWFISYTARNMCGLRSACAC